MLFVIYILFYHFNSSYIEKTKLKQNNNNSNAFLIASPSSPGKTNMGQLVNKALKAGHSKLAWADYEAWTDALDKGKICVCFFFSTWYQTHLLYVQYRTWDLANCCFLDIAENFWLTHDYLSYS